MILNGCRLELHKHNGSALLHKSLTWQMAYLDGYILSLYEDFISTPGGWMVNLVNIRRYML